MYSFLYLLLSIEHFFLVDYKLTYISFFVSVVSHDSASKECKRMLGEAYALNQKLNGQVSEDDLKNLRRKFEGEENQESGRRQKQKTLTGWLKDH